MYLLFDIGGTNLKIAKSKDHKTIESFQEFSTPMGFDQITSLIFDEGSKILDGQKAEVVCGGTRGVLDKEKKLLSDKLLGFENVPLQKVLQEKFNSNVYLENDASFVGLGEATYGVGKDYQIIAYLTISTGIGGTRIVDGKIDEKALGFEPGKQIVFIDNNHTTIENLASGLAIANKYGLPAEKLKDHEAWNEINKFLTVLLNNTAVYWSPDAIILGGSVSTSLNFEKLEIGLKHMLTVYPIQPKILKATLGHLGGLYGALSYIKNH